MNAGRRAALLALLALGGCGGGTELAAAPTPAQRIRFYEGELREHPRSWPSLARLGLAQLDRTRETLDPAELARARASLEASMAIQDSFEGRKGLAAAAAFAHRFEEALEWLERAEQARAEDTAITSLRVEALLALGREDEAALALSAAGASDDFHLASARASLALAGGRLDEAAAAYERAAASADEQRVPSLASWARVRAAAVYLDAGRVEEARARLAALAGAEAEDRFLRVHRAELLELEGEQEAALASFRALLAEADEAELRARAAALARELGLDEEARRHFEAAETLLRRAVDAGEVYTLGGLARLYADAGVRLDEARALAQRNLEHVRDAEARRTLAEIDALLVAARR